MACTYFLCLRYCTSMSYMSWPVHISCVYGIALLWAICHGLYIFPVFKVSHIYELYVMACTFFLCLRYRTYMSYMSWPVHISCVYGIALLWAICHGLYIFSVFKVPHIYELYVMACTFFLCLRYCTSMSYMSWPVHISCVYGIAVLWAICHGLYIFSVFKVLHIYELYVMACTYFLCLRYCTSMSYMSWPVHLVCF